MRDVIPIQRVSVQPAGTEFAVTVPRRSQFLKHGPMRLAYEWSGAIAQLVERFVRIEEVRGSNPLSSTQ
jgi:hypothetical protein